MLWEFMTVQITLAFTAHICSLLIDTLIGELKQTTQVNQFIFNGSVKAGVIGEVKGNLTIIQSDSLTMSEEIPIISPGSLSRPQKQIPLCIPSPSNQEDEEIPIIISPGSLSRPQKRIPLCIPSPSSQEDIKCNQSIHPLSIKQENTVSTTQSVQYPYPYVNQRKRVSLSQGEEE